MIRRTLAAAATTVLSLACAHTPSNEAPAGSGAGAGSSDPGAWQQEFGEDERDLASAGRNAFFVLEPGYTLEFEGQEDGKKAALVIRVLDETRDVGGVKARVVEERESLGGELVEVSRNFFAISQKTHNVYYLGEEVDIYEGGRVAGHEGAWVHGKDGARYGLFVPGTVRVGDRFYQEIAPGTAMDRAEIVSASAAVDTPVGRFDGCLKIEETTPLEPGSKEHKCFAPGIGLVRDGGLRLVRHGKS